MIGARTTAFIRTAVLAVSATGIAGELGAVEWDVSL